MSAIAILLSSYNGTEFVEEQIKSIYDQTVQDFTLYVRDDGSNPQFVEQLRTLQEKYPFVLYEGENVGFVRSFMWLLKRVEDADYYAFADQDDVWLPDKLEGALDWLRCKEQCAASQLAVETGRRSFETGAVAGRDVPLLYHGAYDVITQDGEIKERFYFSNEGYGFRRSITENHYSGFAMVVNRTMRDCMLRGDANQIGYHDWWAAMIAHAFGVGYSDARVCAYHRAHETNVTRITLKSRFQWLWSSLTGESELRRRAVEFERCFGKELAKADANVLRHFTNRRYHLADALWKCCYPGRWRPIWSSELVVRFLMLLGRV